MKPTPAELERAQKLGTDHNRMGPPGAKLVTAWDCDIAQALADVRSATIGAATAPVLPDRPPQVAELVKEARKRIEMLTDVADYYEGVDGLENYRIKLRIDIDLLDRLATALAAQNVDPQNDNDRKTEL